MIAVPWCSDRGGQCGDGRTRDDCAINDIDGGHGRRGNIICFDSDCTRGVVGGGRANLGGDRSGHGNGVFDDA